MASRDDPLLAHPTGFTGQIKLVFGFIGLGMTAAAVFALAKGNQEFLLYIACLSSGAFLLAMMHRRVRFSPGLWAGLGVLMMFHMMGGLVELPRGASTQGKRLLYNWWLIKPYLKYDQVVHAFGSSMATWFCWQLLQRTVASRTGWEFRDLRPTGELLLFCILSGMGIGAINEVIEFYTSQFVQDSNVGGYVNNALDLVFNTIGSLISAAAIYLYYRLRHGKPD